MNKLHYFADSISLLSLPEKFTYPFHYTPHPLCVAAAGEVGRYLSTKGEWQGELRKGKMFGVLIVRTGEGEVGYLAAFSGILAGKNRHTYFVPPVYDVQENLMMAGTVAFSIVAAVAIFMILPYFLSTLMKPVIPSYHLRTVIEGVVRIGIFIVYILLISRMEDIQRTFMYHGAEHKCINCIEHGLPLTVENVRKSSRQHKRCGTSFLFFVLAISIILLLLIRVESPLMRVVVRIALLPVIAGISYEVLKLAGNSENALVNLLSKPGMAIQMMTTSEPDDDMIEVAIHAVEAVFDWRAYERENFHTS